MIKRRRFSKRVSPALRRAVTALLMGLPGTEVIPEEDGIVRLNYSGGAFFLTASHLEEVKRGLAYELSLPYSQPI